MSKIADEMKSRNQKKRKITAYFSKDRVVAPRGSSSGSSSSSPQGFENNNETTTSRIWNDWKQFLEKAATQSEVPALSPEMHKIIWFGHKLKRRPSRMKNEIPKLIEQKISEEYRAQVDMIIKAIDIPTLEINIDKLYLIQGPEAEKKSLINMCSLFVDDIYGNVGATLSISESTFNHNLIKPSLQSCTRYLRKKHYDVTYIPGEVELISMTEQLSLQGMTDHRFRYNADGKILMNSKHD
ncbi:hypothetical protein INT45_008624 [Circinella minor]|uniref:Uncharacterized protein n=1 Tax=Circinella minor TaxID=1195481 RepID=A0A8H7S2R9_9FUNG|nr:hypothetical protein INT45_008624 [Circinella minor]